MRERSYSVSLGTADDQRYLDRRSASPSFWSRLLHWHIKEWLLVIGAAAAVGLVLINALLLQTGPHPAPLFANSPAPGVAVPMVLPRPRPAENRVDLPAPPVTPAAPVSSAHSRAEIVTEIQRELAQRGFYDGAPDGIYGPKTDIAVRDFEHAAGLRPSTEPNETLLRAIARSTIKAPPKPAARDPIGDLLAPSKRIVAVQRALADYGFGQIRPTGAYDHATRMAIEEFERYRRLPVTGQLSERVVRELAAVTGRPLE
ncbi:MAG TPA: peptidoglycan-binding domain-containing protein [Xanthobacteraceae bacterium]|nr:peptidoglycan-binding domain-containing protein [Xanthobacteraceae bacterium]